MYIIMYKYSALKINCKPFPNNIKNPIATSQSKQSPPSPSPSSPGPDRGSPKAKPHAAIRQHGAFLLSSSKRSSPPALNVTVMLHIRRTRHSHLYGLFQCNALPSISCPCIIGKVGSKAFNISLILIENEVTTANFVSEVVKHLTTIVVNGSNHRAKY